MELTEEERNALKDFIEEAFHKYELEEYLEEVAYLEKDKKKALRKAFEKLGVF